MGDRMTPIPFKNLMEWIFEERKKTGRVFGVYKPFVKKKEQYINIFNEKIETPFGPAAGPSTQLAQNIIAAYYTGSRFFELKTVQILDGEDLPVNKPCILAEDEGYNCEWSTELRVPEAYEEYVKAWFALKVISREFNLGAEDGFVFNMSVGYDLAGIKSDKIDAFIENLKNAENTPIWKECMEYLKENVSSFSNVDLKFIEGISPNICTSITVSTLHGCPPQEIESIGKYLIKEKHLNTYIKCNPTLLGYEKARKIMDDMGYDYVVFGDFHFKDDLQFEDAVPMLKRLQSLAYEEEVDFGVKITNTFPVDVTRKELPSEEMYMSGRALCVLSLSVAHKLSEAFNGRLRISYSGGADYFNIDKIYNLGIYPITLATYFLKTGGILRGTQIAEKLENLDYTPFDRVDVDKLYALIEELKLDRRYRKSVKPLPSRKMNKKVPLFACYKAPCSDECPINQDIPTYIKLQGENKPLEALKVIVDNNPLPFITGTICSHTCMNKCTRNFYEESVNIRRTKLKAAEEGYEDLLKELKPVPNIKNKKVAVVGGGPAGIAASFFLAREGAEVKVFEKKENIGGVITNVVPEFRIAKATAEKDISLARALGVEFETNHPINSLEELKASGYDKVILAVGAYKGTPLNIGCVNEMNAIEFLEACRKAPGTINFGKNVVIVGAGNTAMDAARAAKRGEGVENVYVVYRRTRKFMPADEEELDLALEEGVKFLELLAPYQWNNGKLICNKVLLGEMDSSGRQRPMVTEEQVEVLCDLVVAALGEKVDKSYYESLGIKVNSRGYAEINPETMGSSIPGVYVIGDGAQGPATVVEAIRDANKAVSSILSLPPRLEIRHKEAIKPTNKKGIILPAQEAINEAERCLECNILCEACTEVCPNRANVAITVPGSAMDTIIHVDYMCNECGNCRSFCPYDSAPYRDKLTLFNNTEGLLNSDNQGFTLLDEKEKTFLIRLGGEIKGISLSNEDDSLEEEIKNLISTILEDYRYLLMK